MSLKKLLLTLSAALSLLGCPVGSPGSAEREPELARPSRTLRVALRAEVTGFFPVIPLVVPPEAVAFSASLSWEPPLGSALTLSTAVPVEKR